MGFWALGNGLRYWPSSLSSLPREDASLPFPLSSLYATLSGGGVGE